jgi:ribosomal protein L14
MFRVCDTSGAKIAKLILLPGAKRFKVRPGSVVRVSVVKADPKSQIKEGTTHLAVVTSLKSGRSRANGSVVRFSYNSVNIYNPNDKNSKNRPTSLIDATLKATHPDIASKSKEVY